MPFGASRARQPSSDFELAGAISCHISGKAMSDFRRVENKEIRRDPNCMMHAARDQIVKVVPTLCRLTDNTVRADCIQYIISKYGDTPYDTSICSDEYSGWLDWADHMGNEDHYCDHLMFEAIANIYGGFNIITIVGSVHGASIRKSGHPTRPTLYFGLGLEPDCHVYSLQMDDKVCSPTNPHFFFFW